MIPSETIEQIAAANDIVEVIGTYFPLKRAGANFKALCPFHQEKTPSFHVNPQRQTFHCFGCGVGGSVFRFVMEYEHVDFPSAVRKMAARVGIPIVEERGGPDEDRQHEARRTLLKLHAEAAEWFHENLLKKEFAEPARAYLKKRGIDRQVAKDWQLGFAPDSWDAFLKWALERGYSRAQLLQSGLVKPRDEERPGSDVYDRFRGRVMFPICNDVGEVIAFSGRLLESDPQAAKYVNSPETPLFQKGRVLFGLHKTKRALIDANCAIVCEGQLDLITLFEAGIKNVVAPQGTAFTEHQARILKRFVKEVILSFDADSAGRKAAQRSFNALLEQGLFIRVIDIPAGEDPDSIVRTKGKAEFEAAVLKARDYFDWLVDVELRDVQPESYFERIESGRRLAEMIARVPDPLVRGAVVHKVAARLSLPAEELNKLASSMETRTLKSRVPNGISPEVPQVIEQLCRLALRNMEVRDFLLSQNWQATVNQHESGNLLRYILEMRPEPGNAASIEIFLNGAAPDTRPLFTHWLTEKLPEERSVGRRQAPRMRVDWMLTGQKAWKSLQAEITNRDLKVAQTRLNDPNLAAGEKVALQKQIVDLQEQLRAFTASAVGLNYAP